MPTGDTRPDSTGALCAGRSIPHVRYDLAALAQSLADVSRAQGLLMGRLADVGMPLRDQARLSALTEDVIKTSEIEGEQLNVESVRSSIARRLGVDIGALAPVDAHVEGPTGYSGLVRIHVGGWRGDATGPMQVFSGPMGRQRVHFEAPPADRLQSETDRLINHGVLHKSDAGGRITSYELNHSPA